jgi:hypothetical protein
MTNLGLCSAFVLFTEIIIVMETVTVLADTRGSEQKII